MNGIETILDARAEDLRAIDDMIFGDVIGLAQAADGGKCSHPSRRRRCIDHVRQTFSVSERRVCRTAWTPVAAGCGS